MKNRKLLLIVSLVLALTMSLGGTLAYLQDSDADVNVMTLGSVTITQNEHQRAKNADGSYKTATIDNQTSYVLEVYENDKPLLPTTELKADGTPDNHGAGGWDSTPVRMTQIGSYGGMQVFKSKNAADKFVTVTNTGKSDAYVRTIVAVEAGSTNGDLIGTSYHGTWTKNPIGICEIDEKNYYVTEYVYAGAEGVRHENGILPAHDTTYPSLSQVYLKSKATNADMIALDGNNNGKLDILVLSQAIQADGFADAATALNAGFGEVNETNVAEWFKKDNLVVGTPGDKWPSNDVPSDELTVVSTVEELAEALNNNENVILKNDFDNVPVDTTAPYGNKYGIKQDGQTIDGNNKTILFESYGDNYGIMTSGGIIKNVVLKDVARGIVTMNEKEDLVLENVTVTDGVLYPFNTAELGTAAGLELIVNDSKFGGWFSFNGGFEKATFTDCAFVMGNYGYGWPYECLVRPFINTMFDGCDFAETYYLDLSALEDGCKVTLKDCTVNGTKITSDLCGFNCDGTETFCIELPSGRTLADCVIFE